MKTRKLAMEHLELRLPTDCAAVQTAASLVVSCPGVTHDQVEVRGVGADVVVKVDPAAADQVFSGVANLFVDLGAGNDKAHVHDLTLPGIMFVGGGNVGLFDEQIVIERVGVGQQLQVLLVRGSVTVTDAHCGVFVCFGSSVSGRGVDISLRRVSADSVIAIHTGAGDDSISLIDVIAGFSIQMDAGKGRDTLTLGGAFGAPFFYAGSFERFLFAV